LASADEAAKPRAPATLVRIPANIHVRIEGT
jgi:hypothetical protein